MRVTLPHLAAAGLVLSVLQGCAPAAQQAAYVRKPPAPPTETLCADPADKPAFEVTSLKSELMVLALQCNAQDRYNAFVQKYKPTLVREDGDLTKYFSRAYGRNGQHQHDDFITLLANVQADDGVHEGSYFCRGSMPLYDNVLALPPNADLASFSQTQMIPHAVALTTCTKGTRARNS
jgi:hypothetical protein